MAQEPLLCTVCLGVTDVTTVCNSAPRLLLGHSHLLTEVQRSHQRTNLAMWCARFASPPPTGYLAARTPHLICVRSSRVACQHKPTLCWNLFGFVFFSPSPSFFFTHNVCSNLSVPAMAAGVSILSDLPYSVSAARGGAISREMETGRRDEIYCIVLTCLLFITSAKWQQTGCLVEFI